MFYEWRIDHFQMDFPGRDFPSYQQLNSERRRDLDHAICKIMNVPTSYVGKVDFYREVYKRLSAGLCDEDGFDFGEFLTGLDSSAASGNIILYFTNLDDVFVFSGSDCSKYFDYLYYGGSDEVFVMNEQVQWIIGMGTMNRVAWWLAREG